MIERTGDGYLVSEDDMALILVAARLGYAWKREELSQAELHPNQSTQVVRRRTEQLKALAMQIDDAMGVPNRERMIPHPDGKTGSRNL